MSPRLLTDLACQSLDDLIAHADIVIRGSFFCDCELCQRWKRICAEAISLYDGGPAESKADAACYRQPDGN